MVVQHVKRPPDMTNGPLPEFLSEFVQTLIACQPVTFDENEFTAPYLGK